MSTPRGSKSPSSRKSALNKSIVIRVGDEVSYESSNRNASENGPAIITGVHRDDPEDIYYSIKMSKSGIERQTSGKYLKPIDLSSIPVKSQDDLRKAMPSPSVKPVSSPILSQDDLRKAMANQQPTYRREVGYHPNATMPVIPTDRLTAQRIPPLNRLPSYDSRESSKYTVMCHEREETSEPPEVNEVDDATITDSGLAAPKAYKKTPDLPWLIIFIIVFVYVNFVIVMKLNNIDPRKVSERSVFDAARHGFRYEPYLAVMGLYFVAILSLRFFATGFLYCGVFSIPAVALKMCFDYFPDSELYWQHAIVFLLSCLMFISLRDKLDYWGAMLSLASKGFAANAGLFVMLFFSFAFLGVYAFWTYSSIDRLYSSDSSNGVTYTLIMFALFNLIFVAKTILGLQQMITARSIATWYFGYSARRQGVWNCSKTVLANGIGTCFVGTTVGGIISHINKSWNGPLLPSDGDEVEWNTGRNWVHARVIQRSFDQSNRVIFDLSVLEQSGWIRKNGAYASHVRFAAEKERPFFRRFFHWLTSPADSGALICAAMTCREYTHANRLYNLRFRGSFVGRDGRVVGGQGNQSIKFSKRVFDRAYQVLTTAGFMVLIYMYFDHVPKLWDPVNTSWGNFKIWLFMADQASPITNFFWYLFGVFDDIKTFNPPDVVAIYLSSILVIAISGSLHTAGMTVTMAYLEQRDMDCHLHRESTYYKPRVHSLVELEIEKIMAESPPPESFWSSITGAVDK